MTRTAAVVVAALLGIAGIVIGSIALARGGGGGGGSFEAKSLTLQAGKGTRVNYEAPILVKGNPAGVKAWEATYPITGDATGKAVVTCIPLIQNELDCLGGFELTDGDINFENSEHAHTQSTRAEGSILGGSEAYEGAYGSYAFNWKTRVYQLHLWLPKH